MSYRWPCNTKPKLSEPKLSGNLILMLNSALSHLAYTGQQRTKRGFQEVCHVAQVLFTLVQNALCFPESNFSFQRI